MQTPISTLLSQVLVTYTIELDNEFERRFEEAGGGARVVSVVMWSNFLRFVEDGIAVGELPGAAGLQKERMLSTLGGMERWRYVFVGSARARQPPKAKRDGWGSARGLRSDWVVRRTPAGRTASAIWPALFDEIEARWAERFGADAVDELREALQAIVARIDVELPDYLPVVDSASGMAAELPPRERRGAAADASHLAALLSRVLLAYTLDFEGESELSLPLSANFVRVLDGTGVSVRDLPLLTGVSKEAAAMALTFLAKTRFVAVEGTTAARKRARLTPEGQKLEGTLARLQADERGDGSRPGSGRPSNASSSTPTSREGSSRTPAVGAPASPTSRTRRRCWRSPAARYLTIRQSSIAAGGRTVAESRSSLRPRRLEA